MTFRLDADLNLTIKNVSELAKKLIVDIEKFKLELNTSVITAKEILQNSDGVLKKLGTGIKNLIALFEIPNLNKNSKGNKNKKTGEDKKESKEELEEKEKTPEELQEEVKEKKKQLQKEFPKNVLEDFISWSSDFILNVEKFREFRTILSYIEPTNKAMKMLGASKSNESELLLKSLAEINSLVPKQQSLYLRSFLLLTFFNKIINENLSEKQAMEASREISIKTLDSMKISMMSRHILPNECGSCQLKEMKELKCTGCTCLASNELSFDLDVSAENLLKTLESSKKLDTVDDARTVFDEKWSLGNEFEKDLTHS